MIKAKGNWFIISCSLMCRFPQPIPFSSFFYFVLLLFFFSCFEMKSSSKLQNIETIEGGSVIYQAVHFEPLKTNQMLSQMIVLVPIAASIQRNYKRPDNKEPSPCFFTKKWNKILGIYHKRWYHGKVVLLTFVPLNPVTACTM